ncbi:MAG: hypothetical protein JXB46_08855 [Candidatus Eisenbacteria bacterium]|nr:hypothetical protein [Candidatus Eisenbacteria bacterium]
MQDKRPLPPTYLLLGLIAMGLLHFVLSGPRFIHGGWRLLGIALVVVGSWLAVVADAVFKKHETVDLGRSARRVVGGDLRRKCDHTWKRSDAHVAG